MAKALRFTAAEKDRAEQPPVVRESAQAAQFLESGLCIRVAAVLKIGVSEGQQRHHPHAGWEVGDFERLASKVTGAAAVVPPLQFRESHQSVGVAQSAPVGRLEMLVRAGAKFIRVGGTFRLVADDQVGQAEVPLAVEG